MLLFELLILMSTVSSILFQLEAICKKQETS